MNTEAVSIDNDNFRSMFITKDECKVTHSSTKYVNWVVITLMAVFLGLVVITSTVAYQASAVSYEAVSLIKDASIDREVIRRDLEVHVSQITEQQKAMVTSLQGLEKDVEGLRTDQKLMFEEIIRNSNP